MASLTRTVGVLAIMLQGAILAAAATAPGPTMPNIAANCNSWYVVQSGDTCEEAWKAGSITSADFFLWNPDVSSDCVQNFWPTYAYCIGIDSTVSTISSTSTSQTTSTTQGSTASSSSTGTTITTTVTSAPYSTRYPVTSWNITTPTVGTTFPPKETQIGQPKYCIDWHYVSPGDTCQSIVNRYASSLTIDNLLDWNPLILDDCSGLQVGFWVCVRIQAQSSLTLTFNPPSGTPDIPSATIYTPTTLPPVDTAFTPTPTEGPLPTSCQSFYKANAGDRCDDVLDQYPMITMEQFFAWNPVLDDNCDGLWADNYYCVFAGSSDTLPAPITVTTKPSPTGAGGTSNCVAWYQTSGGDDCDLIVTMFGRFPKSDFISWNPSVGDDCNGIVDDMYYCVGIPGTPATRTDPMPTATPTEPPQQSGIAQNCDDFWLVSSLDSCQSIASAKGIELTDFYTWNPAVGNTTSCTNLLPGYDVCVGVNSSDGGSTTTPTSAVTPSATSFATTTSTTATGTAASTPKPVQDGIVNGCQRYYLVESGDGCWAIANSANINLDDFYTWNPAVKSDCTLLLAGYYVCIGISGPTTTITSGPPVPT